MSKRVESNKRVVVKTYLTATEYAKVKRDAKRADVSISTHIRHALLSKRKNAESNPSAPDVGEEALAAERSGGNASGAREQTHITEAQGA